jgi:hypothetical protein
MGQLLLKFMPNKFKITGNSYSHHNSPDKRSYSQVTDSCGCDVSVQFSGAQMSTLQSAPGPKQLFLVHILSKRDFPVMMK